MLLSGDSDALRHTEEGIDANAVSPLSLLALLLPPLLAAPSLGLPWWLLLLWLLTTRVRPVAVTRLLSAWLLWLPVLACGSFLLPGLPAAMLSVLAEVLVLLCWGSCALRPARAAARMALALRLMLLLRA